MIANRPSLMPQFELALRFGDTFPLEDIRSWFAEFAAVVWSKIEEFNV